MFEGPRSKNDNLTILAAPAGYLVSDRHGSDPGAIYELLRALAGLFGAKIFAITNLASIEEPLPKSVSLFEIRAEHDGDTLEQMMFILKCFMVARRMIREWRPKIVHHMNPFAYRGGFNPLALRGIGDLPFIVGPTMYNPPLPPGLLDDYRFMKWGRVWHEARSPKKASINELITRLLGHLNPIREWMFHETLDKSEFIIVVNNATKKAYERVADSKKIKVIPYGVNLQKFPFSPTPNTHEILAIGGLFKRKGIRYLIEAMPAVLRAYGNAKLHIVGNGPQQAALMKLTKGLRVENSVQFHGFVFQKATRKFYKNSRVLCLPSLSEPFGLVVLEAMASGRPVIATDSAGPREIVIDEKSGLIVPRADSDALAEAIIKILGDYELCRKMGMKGRKVVEDRYDWRVIAEQFYEVYTTLL